MRRAHPLQCERYQQQALPCGQAEQAAACCCPGAGSACVDASDSATVRHQLHGEPHVCAVAAAPPAAWQMQSIKPAASSMLH
jgi:hypothetical protein